MSENRVVEVNPEDIEGIPWQDDCGVCQSLKSIASPDLHQWVISTANHMLNRHNIVLKGTDEAAPPTQIQARGTDV